MPHINFSRLTQATATEQKKFEQLQKVSMGEGPISYAEGKQIMGDRDMKVGSLYIDADGDGNIDHLVFSDISKGYSGKKSADVSCAFKFYIFAGKSPNQFTEDMNRSGVEGSIIGENYHPYKYVCNNIEQVRYGDIDGDGDADIAFKLSDGAIKVYHRK